MLEGPAEVATELRCLFLQARFAVEAGVDVFQIRERDLAAADLAAAVSHIVVLARGTLTRVVVNDRLDVALACGAAGVHLRADSIPPAVARSVAPAGFLIGCSVHSVEEAAAAATHADYLIAGTVWPTGSKQAGHRLIGTSGLSDIARATRVPVLAIGGVTLDRLGEVAAAGGSGAAAVGLFAGSRPAGGASDSAAGSGAPAGCRAVPLGDLVQAARGRFDTSGSAS